MELPRSGSWLVRRRIPGVTDAWDAASCYPLLCCAAWEHLPEELARLDGVVTVVAVVDPLADADPSSLREAFPDLLRAYKQHHIVDLEGYGSAALSAHHRRNVLLGHRACDVTVVDPPLSGAGEWVALYAQLVRRRSVRGRADLPDAALRAQLAVPGACLLRADVDGDLAGMVLWMCSDGRAYYHLGAFNDEGYRARAAYALFDTSLRHLAAVATSAVLGGGAGVEGGDDGLVRFKRGWGTSERPAWLGGRVLDTELYERLSASTGHDERTSFPSYRAAQLASGG